MSILKSLKWFLIDQFTFGLGGGGGGSSQPTQTNVQNTNIPEYARPYVETMLGTAQQQVYDMSGGNVTGFKPYQPYSTNPQDYVAALSPLQSQAMGAAAQMQTPGQFQTGSQMAGMGGVGTLSMANAAGRAGANYAAQATNPYAVQSYMNPYLSASLQPQLAEMNRQGQLAANQAASQATSAGAFGGTRGQLAQAEAQRNALMAQQNLIGQGYNTAYNQAQQAMQYGAGLGLQGQQAAMQGYGQLGTLGSQLGNLGTQQRAAQEANINLQNTLGAQAQTQQQNIINQAIQNYATAQQYPMQQLANMSALLRGLPLQSTTTQSYAAQPTALSTLAGLGTGIAGAAKLLGNKGGLPKDFEVKEMAGGGITSLENRQRLAEKLSPKQLDVVIANRTIPQDMGAELKQDDANMAQRAAMADAAAQVAAQQQAGISAAQTNLPVEGMAQGGIVAFADGGDTSAPYNVYTRPVGAPDINAQVQAGLDLAVRNTVAKQRAGLALTQDEKNLLAKRGFVNSGINQPTAATPQLLPTPVTATQTTQAAPTAPAAPKGPATDAAKEDTSSVYNITPGSTSGFLADVKNAFKESRQTLEDARSYEGKYAPQLKKAISEQEAEAYKPAMTREEAETQAAKGYEGTPYAELEKSIRGRMAGYDKEKDQALGQGLLAMSEQFLSNPTFAAGLGKGLGALGNKYGAEMKEIKAAQRQDEKGLADIEQAKRLEAQGKYKEADRLYERGQDRQQAARNTLTGTLSSINAQDISKAAQFATAEAGLGADQAKAIAGIGMDTLKLQQAAAQAIAQLKLLDKHYATQDKATQMQYLKIRSAAANNVAKDPNYQEDLARLATKYKNQGGVDSDAYKYDAEALRIKYLNDHMGDMLSQQELGVRTADELLKPAGQ